MGLGINLCVALSVTLLAVTVTALEDRYGLTQYATKTPYVLSHNETEWDIVINSTRQQSYYVPSQCRPISVDLIQRHGTRNPGNGDTAATQEIAARIKDKVMNPDYAGLNDWNPPFTPEGASMLIEEGKRELFGLGSRMVGRYPELFDDIALDDIDYMATSKIRTVDSGIAFQEGFSTALSRNLTGPLVERDDILRFYDHCEKYIQEVEDNEEAFEEVNDYYNLPRLQQIGDDVAERIGLEGASLTFDDMEVIYSTVLIEIARVGSSPWYGVFTDEELALLEYGADMQNYYEESYAYPISYQQSCVLFSSVFDQMADSKEKEGSGESYTKGTFRFAHSQAIMATSTITGLYEPPVPLRADNYEELLYTRRYRSATTVPKAANLEFVLYKCDTTGEVGTPPVGVSWPDTLQEYMVQFLLNEIPIKFPACDSDLCPYDQVVNTYSDYIGCNFEELCAVESK